MFPRPTYSHIAYYIAFPLIASILIGLGIWWMLYLRRQGRHGSKGPDAERRPARRASRVGAGGEEIALQRPASVFLVVGEPAGAFDARGRGLGTTTTIEAGVPRWM